MNNFLTGSIYKFNFSASKKTEVFDTEIDELYQTPQTIIKTSDDFWNFFNDTSSAIPIFTPDDRSHQYLVNNANLESTGSIVVWTNNDVSITFNDVPRIYQDSRSLVEQVNLLQSIVEESSITIYENISTIQENTLHILRLTQDSSSLVEQLKVCQSINDDSISGSNNNLSISIPNGSFENWTNGSLNDWDANWQNPISRVSPTTGVDGGTGVSIGTTEYFVATTEQPNLRTDFHTAIKLQESKSLWLEPTTTYRLSGMYKTSGSSSTAQIWIGDGRGAGIENNYSYSWSKLIAYNNAENWSSFEMYFIPKYNIYTDSDGLPYLGTKASIYLYNGIGYNGTAYYDDLKIEKILDYTVSESVSETYYGTGETISALLQYDIQGDGFLTISGDQNEYYHYTQNIVLGENGLIVTAVGVEDQFISWSDGRTDNPRQDTNVTSDINVTALFDA